MKKKAKAAVSKKSAAAPKKTATTAQPKAQNGAKKVQVRQPVAKKVSQNGQARHQSSSPAKRTAGPVNPRNVTIKVAPTKKQGSQPVTVVAKAQKAVDPHKVIIRVRPQPTANTKTASTERANRGATATRDNTNRREQAMQNARKPKAVVAADSSLASRFATVSAR